MSVKGIEGLVEPSDAELVRRSQRGDRGAFRELVARYYQKIFRLALGMLNDREEALDATQETFLRAYKSIKGFRGSAGVYTWLYRIAANLALDRQRRESHNPVELRDSVELESEAAGQSAPDPAEGFHNRRLGERIVEAIAGLTPEHRAVVVLRAVEGLSYKEIARVVGCSEGTVMSRLYYARKKLQKELARFL